MGTLDREVDREKKRMIKSRIPQTNQSSLLLPTRGRGREGLRNLQKWQEFYIEGGISLAEKKDKKARCPNRWRRGCAASLPAIGGSLEIKK